MLAAVFSHGSPRPTPVLPSPDSPRIAPIVNRPLSKEGLTPENISSHIAPDLQPDELESLLRISLM